MKWFKKANPISELDPVLDLKKWWMDSFSKAEREYISERFKPMGGDPNRNFIDYLEMNSTPNAYKFLGGLSTWFRDKDHASIADRIHEKIVEIAEKYPLKGPGFFNGRHYTTYVPDIDRLKKSGANEFLEQLLLDIIDTVEKESQVEELGVAPAYYYELAVLYRKSKDYAKEVGVLERFSKQQHAPGVLPGQLIDRLQKAKVLQEKQN